MRGWLRDQGACRTAYNRRAAVHSVSTGRVALSGGRSRSAVNTLLPSLWAIMAIKEDKMKHRYPLRHGRWAVALIALLSSLAFAASASAAPTPPFTQCPTVGYDKSCEILIVVNPNGSIQSYRDPSTGTFDGEDDTLIGIQNNSSVPVTSISLKGANIFGFDGDGLCSGVNTTGGAGFEPPPAGCPFNTEEKEFGGIYEGPMNTYSPSNFNEGTVNFTGNGIPPGGSTYFSLESAIEELVCKEGKCETVAPTSTFTYLLGAGQFSPNITVEPGQAVYDYAYLNGSNVPEAGGTVEYSEYSNPECTDLVATSTVNVSGGVVPGSSAGVNNTPGTYYWVARYSGDEHNLKSESRCGSETVTVLPPTCKEVVGVGHIGARGPEGLNLDNNLNTTGAGRQQFEFTVFGEHMHLSHLENASCHGTPTGGKEFTGEGPAKIDGQTGWYIRFAFAIEEGVTYLTVHLFNPLNEEVYGFEHLALNKTSHEHIS